MTDRNRTIVIGRDDSVPDVLRELLALASHPAEVAFVTGTRDVQVTEAVADAYAARQQGPDLDSVVEPEETPRPRKRAPRKAAAPAAEES